MTATPVERQSPVTELTEPYWSAARRGELALQRCNDCGHIRFPISTICPACLSSAATWTPMSGDATVQSYVVFERAYDPAWRDRVPYVVALIELSEGPVIISNVVDIDPSEVTVGMAVRVTFQPLTDDAALPVFRPTDTDIEDNT